MKNLSLRTNKLWVGILISLQLITFIWGHHIPHELNAILFVSCSTLIGIITIIYYYKKSLFIKNVRDNRQSYIPLLFILIAISLAIGFDYLTFLKRPILVKESDVIPTIIELCQRFIAGDEVYKPIEKFGYYLPVTYLPMQWIPYLPAELFQFDYRWIAITIWLIVFFAVFRDAKKFNNNKQLLLFGLLFVLPFFFISIMPNKPIGAIMVLTVELMVASYYVLLMKSINFKNPLLRGLIVGICLMSRYSLVLWLPLALLVLWFSEPLKKTYLTIAGVLGFIGIIYIIPFLSNDWEAFYRGYKYYDSSAYGEWTTNYDGSGLPHHLFRGYGFASFIYSSFPNLSIEARISLMQKIHLFGSLSVVGMLTLLFIKIRENIDYRIFLMASFKIYIAVFLFLIQVPYQYLMLVDVYVSIILLWELSKFDVIDKKQLSYT